MPRMRWSIALAFALLACAAGSARALPPRSSYAELDRLAKWMAGSFSNAAQAGRDTSFADVRLRIVPIWPERTEARWF